ncbi:MAG: J domain-containing protein [Clostridia bacterium]|nr:J domain-containing protein [Clostridia bacterium]
MAKNPYSVLGISPGATDEQIKAAYKEMVKKYHPDKYQQTDLKEVAEEKLSEVNVAYDTIVNERAKGNTGYNTSDNSQQTYTYNRQNPYRQTNYRPAGGGTSMCDVCSCLICSDCCCECCGGDLIACC